VALVWDNGFLLDADTRELATTADGTGAVPMAGLLRNPDGALVVDDGGTIADEANGYPITSAGALVIDTAADVADGVWEGGFLRVDGKLAATTGGTYAPVEGFWREDGALGTLSVDEEGA
jgi:hypothetical protein